MGLEWPKIDILDPSFAKPIVSQQYLGICIKKNFRPIFFKKMGQKAIFQISKYGQLWPNYDHGVIFFFSNPKCHKKLGIYMEG